MQLQQVPKPKRSLDVAAPAANHGLADNVENDCGRG